MNRTRSITAAFALAGIVGVACSARVTPPAVAASPPAASVDSANFDVAAALRTLEASIQGRENAPAESVWKNIQGFKGMPAGRLLRVMETGFSKSLGVDCLHCHVPTDWASDDKRPKRVTREMMAFSRAVNASLKELKELDSKEPTVNCTTCHRGQVKPALNL
jgi:hypothetical protein